eukprot:2776395-Rhodomonas_salina.2
MFGPSCVMVAFLRRICVQHARTLVLDTLAVESCTGSFPKGEIEKREWAKTEGGREGGGCTLQWLWRSPRECTGGAVQEEQFSALSARQTSSFEEEETVARDCNGTKRKSL